LLQLILDGFAGEGNLIPDGGVPGKQLSEEFYHIMRRKEQEPT
jgi:hypothetical protein